MENVIKDRKENGNYLFKYYKLVDKCTNVDGDLLDWNSDHGFQIPLL